MSELKVRITGDSSGFSQALNSAKMAAKGFADSASRRINAVFGSQLTHLLGAAAVVKLTKDTIDFASQMRDLSDTLGINVEWLQKLRLAAIQTGGSAEDLNKFLLEIQKSRQAAMASPKGKEAESFRRMGISGSDVQNLPAQQFAQKIISAFSGGATAQLVNDVQEVGGRAAKNLIATFQQGIDESASVMSEALVDQLDDIGDAFDELKTTLMVDFAPAIMWAVNGVKDFVFWVQKVGAFLGGVSAEATSGNGYESASGAIDALMIAGGQAIIDAEEKRKAQEDSRQSAREAKREARRARESSAPGFEVAGKVKDYAGKSGKGSQGFSASMAELGLYSSSWLKFGSEDKSLERQQLKQLETIARNTATQQANPFR